MSVNKPLGFHPPTCIHPGNEGQAHLPAETEPPSGIDVGGINQLTTAAPHSLHVDLILWKHPNLALAPLSSSCVEAEWLP